MKIEKQNVQEISSRRSLNGNISGIINRKNLNQNKNEDKNGRLKKAVFGLLAPALLLISVLISGCSAASETEEAMQPQQQDEALQTAASQTNALQTDASQTAASQTNALQTAASQTAALQGGGGDEALAEDDSRISQADAGKGSTDNAEAYSIEMTDEEREELTTQLLQEKNMDTSIVDSAKVTKGCTFELPEDFEEAGDMPGMYVNEHYPVDAATVYYSEKDKDASLQLMTEAVFVRNTKAELKQVYGHDVEIELEAFEKTKIDGYPAFRILYSYKNEEVMITQLEYIINADKSYVIIYSQTDEYDRMEEFEASAETIRVES